MRVGVVGAGLGGMAAAIRLGRAGHEVTVFEQLDTTGGKAASLEASGYRFDTGPSLVTMPQVFRTLFEAAGQPLESHLTFLPLEPLCLSFFPDGAVLRESSDLERMAQEIRRVSGRPPAVYHRYMRHAHRVWEAGKLFLHRPIHGILREGLSAREWLGLVHLDALRSFHRANHAYFRDPRVVQMMDRFATFNGSDPYRAPATLCIIPAVEYGGGAYAVAGGIRRIPEAYERVARALGVRFELGRRVERILVEGGRARGLVTARDTHPMDAVVCNADVRAAYRTLLPPGDPLARRQEKLEPSISGIVFLWGMGAVFPELSTNNVFYSGDYRREFVSLFAERRVPEDPTVYVNITSKTTPEDAPRGCENWFVLVNAPPDPGGRDWSVEVERTRAALLRRVRAALGRDVEGLIRCETVITPADMEARTGAVGGSLYGIASNTRLTAFLRHPNRHPRIRGLYFCGGSAHPGGGMPLVTLSGMMAADLVLRHEGGAG